MPTELISDKVFGLEKLDWLPKKNLRILRNSIFARYGYIFKSQDLQDYFGNKSWYIPSASNVDNMLTPVDKDIISYLSKLENK